MSDFLDSLRAKPKDAPLPTGPVGPQGPENRDLDPISHHVQAALEVMRGLPVTTLQREQSLGLIYNLLGTAMQLIVEYAKYGAADHSVSVYPEPLKDDLAAILGE